MLLQRKPSLTACWQSGRGHLKLSEVGPLLIALVTYPAQHSLQSLAANERARSGTAQSFVSSMLGGAVRCSSIGGRHAAVQAGSQHSQGATRGRQQSARGVWCRLAK